MYLYGASGHAKVIVDVVTSCGQSVEAIVDDDKNKTALHEIPVIHESEGLSPFIVRKLLKKLGRREFLK